MKKIYGELARIQQGLRAPKNLYNKFGSYYYRNAEGILEAVKPLLGDSLAIVINDEPVVVGDRIYVKATVTLTDGEESVSSVAYAREDETKKGMDGCQITGACSSYARKYALNALLMIDDSKDSDDDSLSPKNPDNQEKQQKPQSAPREPQNKQERGAVTMADKIPAGNAKGPEQAVKPQENKPESAGQFMQRRIAEMKKEYASLGFDFVGVRKVLIEGGQVPDVPSATMTMEQAQQLMREVEFFYEEKKAAS